MTWGCSDLTDEDRIGDLGCGKNAFRVWDDVKGNGHFTCRPGIGQKSGFGAHDPITSDVWEASRDHFVGMFRQPEQRLVSGLHHQRNVVKRPTNKSGAAL